MLTYVFMYMLYIYESYHVTVYFQHPEGLMTPQTHDLASPHPLHSVPVDHPVTLYVSNYVVSTARKSFTVVVYS